MKSANQKLGWLIGLLLPTLGVLLWLGVPQPGRDPWQTWAQLSLIIGMTMVSYALILDARLKPMEWLFDGLDRLYRAHFVFRRLGFLLVLIPVALLGIDHFQGGLLLPTTDAVRMAVFAEVGIAVLILLTDFGRFKHQTLVKLEHLKSLLFIVVAAEVFLLGQLPEGNALLIYLLLVVSLATLIFLCYSLLGNFFIRRFGYQVIKVQPVDATVTEVILKPTGLPMRFIPGQFAFVSLVDEAVDTEAHPYAMISRTKERNIHIVVKDFGDYTHHLKEVKPGATAWLRGPYGTFSYLHYRPKRQIWIAGGIGITPFLSMLQSLPAKSSYQIDLYYCTKTKSEAVYSRMISGIAKKAGVRVFFVCEETDGFLSADTVAKNEPHLLNAQILICGPPAMMSNLHKQFRGKGLPEDQVRTEEFKL